MLNIGRSMCHMEEIDVLRAYSTGELPRSVAMHLLGIDWYGDLLILLNQNGVPRPTVPDEDARLMSEVVERLFTELDSVES